MNPPSPTGSVAVSAAADGATFAVRVTPRAKRNAVAGVVGNALKVYLTAPPADGRANDALLELLAEVLGVKRRQLAIVTGATNRNKVIRVTGLARDQVAAALAAAL